MVGMNCFCGANIPRESELFPMKEQKVTMIYKFQGDENEITTGETQIVRCQDKRHTDGTGWNFAAQAEYRHEWPRAKKLMRKR